MTVPARPPPTTVPGPGRRSDGGGGGETPPGTAAHSWVVETIDGGHVGCADVFHCTACGAGGGFADRLDQLPGNAFYPNGSGLRLPDDCSVSKLIVAAFELGASRPDLGKAKPDKVMRKIFRGWLDRISRGEKTDV